MSISRRTLLKIAGLTAHGATAGKFVSVRSDSTSTNFLAKAVGAGKRLTKRKTAPTVRLAMVVDLKKCISEKGCSRCIDACNKVHNIPDFGESKDEIKWIWKEPYEDAFLDQENFFMKDEFRDKKVPVFCNNCDNPPCVEVCPTQATFKRDDGIVMMDWHRCIGCRYCMAACPYGSRSFNWRDPRPFIKDINPDFPTRTKGVVEKCTWCDERVSQGLLPLCVEACPVKAMAFGNLNDPASEVRELLKDNFSVRRKPGLGTSPEIFYLV
ncbi:MAG TPA: 4Fe-4S dicluster domain-containing protein [Candidatus Kryptobacter bacterium]|nr:4Fe-4S dicluster domain-containing protein [Candidatus Kryptobacter bacterium]